ncbi:MAG: alpha/beta fold hydrolase [Flavobacteriaceae bacterium]|nr:alpha/beta fold hydrolase [Flavobacteriaceae bacterium]
MKPFKMNFTNYGVILFLILFSSCTETFKLLEEEDNIYALTTETQLKDKAYSLGIANFYNQGKEGFLPGKANVPIYYKMFQQPEKDNAAIFISAGRTEAAIKYKELIYDLYNRGYSIYIHDHRGQGLSGRMVADTDMGYIDEFQYYIDDMKVFYDNISKTTKHKSFYLLAHSMGGAIGMTYLEQYPNDFNAAAFSSPMLGFDFPNCAVVGLLSGDTPKYAIGQGKYNDDEVAFKENTLTGSEIRYNRMNAAFSKEPKAKLGGATYQWVLKSCQQFDYINENIKNIKTPFILFSSENEQIINTNDHQKFVEKAQELGKECKAYTVENAQHELLIEKDVQRIKTINEILKYFDMH